MREINLIRPSVFGDDVNAFFTLKNEGYNSKSKIRGLNLGYNTAESDKVITKNRRKLLRITGIDNVAYAKQIHGSDIKFVKEPGTAKKYDGLITNKVGLALAIQVADCAAVLIYEPESRTIAAVHAGWRGAAAGIIPKALQAMQRKGAVLSSARAYVSPCICDYHFEVGEEVAERFPAQFVDYENFSKPHVNLKRFIKDQLTAKKLKPLNIEVDEGCTIDNKLNFYSYRRKKEECGRMLAVIQIK